MAATIAGALKALIESAGLGLAAYRDEAPKDASPPFVIIHEGISLVPDPSNARYDGSERQAREEVQVSLWQQWRTTGTGGNNESYTVADALKEALDGAELPTSGNGAPPKHVWGLRFLSSRRILDRDNNRVHTPMTVEVIRNA